MRTLLLPLLSLSLLPFTTPIQLFPSPGSIPTLVPAACRAVLSANITCEPDLVRAASVAAGRYLGEETTALYCTDACYKSLNTFRTNVKARCGETRYAFYPDTPNYLQSGVEIAEGFGWAWNVTCVKDSDGFCLQPLFEGKKEICSDCFLKYQALLLSSDYGRRLVDEDEFTTTLKSCGVPTTSYTYTYSTRPTTTATTTTTSEPTATPRCEGGMHKVTASDTCPSIAKAAGNAVDRMIVNNGLDYNCTSLKVGSEVCLEKPCKLHTVVEGETCADMYEGTDWGMNMLISWNPTIHRNCDNFDAFVGRSICVSPPGSLEFVADPVDEGTTTIVPIITATWEEGPVELTPIPFNTTWYSLTTTHTLPTQTAIVNETRENLISEKAKYCWITSEMWERGFDPYDLTAGCQTLYNRYCEPNPDAPAPTSARIPAVCTPTVEAEVVPAKVVASLQAFRAAGAQGAQVNRVAGGGAEATVTGSVTRVSAAGPVPTPVQEGMVSDCKKFFRVRHDGESCRSIARHWNVPESKFISWNPAVGKDCDGLAIGYYVCISA